MNSVSIMTGGGTTLALSHGLWRVLLQNEAGERVLVEPHGE
jgi:hypothetical protein